MQVSVGVFLFVSLFVLCGCIFCANARKNEMELNIFADVEIAKDVEYAVVDDLPLLLDIYMPKSKKPLPVIVFVHGGGWSGMDKENPLPVTIGCLDKGYVVASINYRLSNVAKFPAQIHDCKAAIRFLRANAKKYNLDPDRVGVWGVSAGGHLVALLGVTNGNKCLEGEVGGNLEYSSKVQAVCDYCGPTDLTRVDVPYLIPFVENLLGGTVEEKHELAVKASPLSYVDTNVAPMLIIHGEKDQIVDVNQSIWFYNALKKAGTEVELSILPETPHTTFVDVETLAKVETFFEKHLR